MNRQRKAIARRNRCRVRRLHHEQLESRRVLTLPAIQTFAEGELLVFNGPTVDTVNDTPSFDAFIDFGGDIDSFFFAPQFSGTYTIDVGDFGNTVDPEVAVYIAATGARIGYNDDLSIANDDARLVINLTSDIRYIIAVADEPATTSGNVSIVVTAPFRTGSSLLTPDIFGDATTSVLLDVPTDIDYFTITAPSDATGGLSISAIASTFDHRLALFDSAGTLLQGPLVSIGISNVTPGAEFRIAVFSNDYNSFGTLTLNVNFAEPGAVVTNTLDSGPGSLRQAIIDANNHPNPIGTVDDIVFNIPGPGPHTIALASALPIISDAVEIDGGTQPGSGTGPTVAIDGSALVGSIDGLRITANGSTIRQLNIRNFPNDGIEIQANGVLLENNAIGTDFGGLVAAGNANFGIRIQGSSNIVELNLVSANGLSGIAVVGDTSDDNALRSNFIGSNANGNTTLPNGGNGIVIIDGDTNLIDGNLISGNALAGAVLSGNANTNTITANVIGTNIAGTEALPNNGDGILIQSGSNQIGGSTAAARNIVSGNGKSGITISGLNAANNVVEGNFIGTNAAGTLAIPNVGNGIRVINGANNRIGSAVAVEAGNLISGNGGSGITFSQPGSTGGLVVGNFIGTSVDGLSAIGNLGHGVLINAGATNIQVGGSTAIERNVISGNGATGVTIATNSNNNRVSRNRIGTNLSGTPLGNASSGVFVQSSDNTIGGASTSFTNIIAGNANGITLSGVGATQNTVAFNTIGTNAASNIGRGIQIVSSSSGNTIGPSNTIRRNESGIRVNDGSTQNRITENSIGENTNLGIDLVPVIGVTANDVGDADVGGNLLQNTPVISGSPLLIGANLEFAFSVNSSPANAAYPLTVEFYVSDGSGEGATFIGNTLYTAANFTAGVKSISFAGAGAGLTVGVTRFVALATDLNGNTSEFSAQRTLAAGGALLSAARSSSTAQQNGNSLDVNDDGVVSPVDALSLISFLSRNRTIGEAEQSNSVTTPNMFYDTNGDGLVTPLDALLVIQGLFQNRSTPQATPPIEEHEEDHGSWDEGLVEVLAEDLA